MLSMTGGNKRIFSCNIKSYNRRLYSSAYEKCGTSNISMKQRYSVILDTCNKYFLHFYEYI